MIKHFLKFFLASVTFITVILSGTSLAYILFDNDVAIGTIKTIASEKAENLKFYESGTFDYNSDVGKAAKNMKRFNVLVVGLENKRTDTIMVVSYDMENKKADLISIPRDTYNPRNEDDGPDLKKINAVYSQEGIDELVRTVQEILGIPLEKYVVADYDAVVDCVDILGGVEVTVPFHMVYSDPYDDPPLTIDIPEGKQVLDGEQSLKFLRYRKGYDNQDLGRIDAQQQFIKSALKKTMGLKLPALVKEVYTHVKTNVRITDILNLADDISGFTVENMSLCTMPGTETPLEGLSFYIPDEEGIKGVVNNMYGIENDE
jgi:LCP family protein required for cell wall assembly